LCGVLMEMSLVQLTEEEVFRVEGVHFVVDCECEYVGVFPPRLRLLVRVDVPDECEKLLLLLCVRQSSDVIQFVLQPFASFGEPT
jgi:hypothetical protein